VNVKLAVNILNMLARRFDCDNQPLGDLAAFQAIRLAVQQVVQEMLEQEVSDYLGRERYDRRNDGQDGYRNGYERGRIRSAEAWR
jgi:transposase-like protein